MGELAQASGLSPATIRRYGAAGVLPPVQVDAQSGYRYYSRAQVETAVLARTLRQLDVPLDEVRAILEEPDAASRLARLETHWQLVSEQVDRGRRERDHVARLFSGFQELIDSFEVWTRPVEQVGALVRRRIVTLFDVPDLTRESVQAMTARAAAEGRSVLGRPVLRYGWPPERPDVDNADAPREVEVCLPVSGDPTSSCPAEPSPRPTYAGRTPSSRSSSRCWTAWPPRSPFPRWGTNSAREPAVAPGRSWPPRSRWQGACWCRVGWVMSWDDVTSSWPAPPYW